MKEILDINEKPFEVIKRRLRAKNVLVIEEPPKIVEELSKLNLTTFDKFYCVASFARADDLLREIYFDIIIIIIKVEIEFDQLKTIEQMAKNSKIILLISPVAPLAKNFFFYVNPDNISLVNSEEEVIQTVSDF